MTTRRKKKPQALGDDPLSWIKEQGAPQGSKEITNTTDSAKADSLKKNTAPDAADASAPAITLEPIITIGEVNKIFATLTALLSQDRDLNIDASKVQMLDTAGLQLLLCFSQELQARHYRINWISPSPAFIQSAELAGLSALLNLSLR